jgi:adenosylhomocysteine nucleosidase
MSAVSGVHPVFLQTGIGIADPRALAERVAAAGVSGLISIGTAGGLMPDLAPGALLLPATVRDADGNIFPVDSEWHARVCTVLEKTGRVHTGDVTGANRVVRHPDQKKSLRQQTQAIGVDMESAALAKIAADAGLPFLVLRVVMDTAADEIPEAAMMSIDKGGNTRSMALLRHLLIHWPDIPGLMLTMARFKTASSSLREACRLARNELLCPR